MLFTDSFYDYLLYERNYAANTVSRYRADILELQNFVVRKTGCEDVSPSDVDADLIREWMVLLMDGGAASSTINRKLSSVRALYRFLLRKKLVSVDP